MTIEELRKLCDENVTVRVWPEAGQALGLKRNKAYEAARAGKIQTIPLGTNMRRVPTTWLRKVTGLDSIRNEMAQSANGGSPEHALHREQRPSRPSGFDEWGRAYAGRRTPWWS